MYKVITPVSTEPVTLSEVKLHLRLSSDSFSGDTITYQSIVPGSKDISTINGTAVDVLGLTAIVNLNSGTVAGSVASKIQESDDNITWQDFEAFTVVTAANDNAIQEKEYTGSKQYIRVVATVTVAACEFSADIITKTSDTTEDTLLTMLITAAREYCEKWTGRALATQTIEAYLDSFPVVNRIALPLPPLQSVTSLIYKDGDGTDTTMTVTTDYIVDTDSDIGKVVLPNDKSWPSFTPYPINPIKIRYVTGYTVVPKTIKLAMLLLIGHWHSHREAVNTGSVSTEIAFAVKTLLSQYRVRWWD